MDTDISKDQPAAEVRTAGGPDGSGDPSELSPSELSPSEAAARALREKARPRRREVRFGLLDVVWFLPRQVMRLFFPRLVDRYILGELMAPLVFGWTMFIVLFVFSLNLVKLGQMLARGADPNMIGEMLWLRVVLSSVLCLPMAMLLSGLLAFGRLSGDSELIATQAGGIPNYRLIRNALLLGLVLSFAGLALNEYVIPPAGRRLDALEDQIKKQVVGKLVEEVLQQKVFSQTDTDPNGKISRMVAAQRFEPSSGSRPATMYGATYVQFDKERPQLLIQADRAELLLTDPKKGVQEWRFLDAEMQMMAALTPGERIIWSASKYDVTISAPQEATQGGLKLKDPTELSYAELKAYIKKLKKQGIKEKRLRPMRVELQRKLSVPFAAVVLALIGASLGIRRQRSTTGVGIGLSLLIIVIYYIGMSVLGIMGESGKISTREAAWGCNVVGLFVGLFLAWRSSR